MSTIESKNISIVVQGPIYGRESDPENLQFTKICVESLRNLFPKSEIILSTWNDVSQNWIKYDRLVVNEEPPLIEKAVTKRKDVNYNGNRLICSTANGVKATTRDYVLKVRSDVMFTSNHFLEEINLYPARDSDYQISEHRIVIPELLTSLKLFSINDWVSFGARQDMLKLWEVPYMHKFILLSEKEDLFMSNEQYICSHFLKSHPLFSLNNQEILERLFVNNFLILNATSFSFRRLKPFPFSITRYLNWTSHYDWKCLYKTYCLRKETVNYLQLIRPTVFALGRFKASLKNIIKIGRYATD